MTLCHAIRPQRGTKCESIMSVVLLLRRGWLGRHLLHLLAANSTTHTQVGAA